MHLPFGTAANDQSAGKQLASRDGDGMDRMAIFRAYAKVLEPDDPTMLIYEAGLRACPGPPGLVLADVLRRTGGVYEMMTPLVPELRDDICEVAELTSDPELLAMADLTEVPVSLDHLRGLDPQTRFVVRTELCYEGDEGARVRSKEHRPALATIMPDGTVIAGDAMTAPSRRHRDEPGSPFSAPTGPAHPYDQDECANPLPPRGVGWI